MLGLFPTATDGNMKQYPDCDCYYMSRFDPDGNLVKLVTCKGCLTEGLALMRKTLDRPGDHWIQLELREEGCSTASETFYVSSQATPSE